MLYAGGPFADSLLGDGGSIINIDYEPDRCDMPRVAKYSRIRYNGEQKKNGSESLEIGSKGRGIMALQFILGNSGAGKSWYGYHDMIQRAMEHPDRTYLIVVPEQFTMQTQKELVSMHPSGGILNIDVLSFQRLAYRIFGETGGSLCPLLGETGKNLVVKRVAQEKKAELEVLGSTLKKTGAVSQMKSLVSELKQYQIDPSTLEQWAEMKGEKRLLSAKLRDVEKIYRAFDEYLENRYVTAEDVLEVLSEKLEESRWIRGCEVLVDGFTGFTPVQIGVLRKLFCLCPRVAVTVILDEREDPYGKILPHQLFAMSRKMVQQLVEAAREAQCEILQEIWVKRSKKSRFCPGSALDYLEQNLFRYHTKPYAGTQQEIFLRVMKNPREELEDTVRQIRRMVREENMRYKDFAVLTGDLASYGTYAREIFEKCHIPCFVDEKRSVLMNPLVEYLRAAVDLVIQGFTYESVFRYLRCGLSDFTREEIDRLENYCIALGIRGKKAYQENWTRAYRGQKPEEVVSLNELRKRFYEEISEFAEGISGRGRSVLERTQALYGLMEKNRLQEKIAVRREEFLLAGNAAMAKEYDQIYGIVIELLDKMAEVLSDERLTLAEYQEILEAGFAEASVGVIPPAIDQVLVGDNERTRLKDIKVLFFVGVNEGLIPKSAASGGILSETDREELEKVQAHLSCNAREEMYMQRFHLYRNLTKPSEKLYLSFARSSASGEALTPSYLIGMIRGLFPGLEITDQEDETSPEEILELSKTGETVFLEGLSRAANGDREPLFEELYRWYQRHPEDGVPVDKYREAAFYTRGEGIIGKSAAAALYGRTLTNSATRLEKYAACAFAHFMEYGLKIREREQYEFKPADMGTVMHEALESFSKKLEKSGSSWRDMDEELRDRLIEESVREVMDDYKNTVLQSSQRNRYMVSRVTRILRRTVWALQEQVKRGSFEPGEFEVSFAMEESLSAINIALSEEEKIRLRGRIDRVDLCETPEKVYVKIIDYKSGSTTLDLVALYYGLQLQLAVYLDAAVELEQRKHPEKQVEPAGVFYYHIQDPMLEQKEGETDEEWGRRMLSALKLDGLVNQDREVVELLDGTLCEGTTSEIIPVGRKKDGGYTSYSKVADKGEFDTIREYTRLKIRELGRGILDGNTSASPYKLGARTACNYCPYHGICGFDQNIPGFEYRKLSAMDTDLLLSAMREETKENQERQPGTAQRDIPSGKEFTCQ
ncbi:MAG: helicase-exonuclease AddAB subunit AddB [Lachnospiraceae bacterium]|nr:helicase-exonuclease AddAB subunit AddB [Lachnospiraceae bacterium]